MARALIKEGQRNESSSTNSVISKLGSQWLLPALCLLKEVPECKDWSKIRSERGVLVIPMQEKNVPKRRYGLRPSEKELAELRSSAFRHKNNICYCTALQKLGTAPSCG
jgi:hypothetical protein